MNTRSCLNLIPAYGQACETSRVLSECDPAANGSDLSLLEKVSTLGLTSCCMARYILDRKSSSSSAVAPKPSALSYKLTQIFLVPFALDC